MKKKILYVIFLIMAGTAAYYGGYHAYTSNRPKVELVEPEKVQKAIQTKGYDNREQQEYYVGKIEEDHLVIYKMPEDSIYDSIRLGTLNFYGEEVTELKEGMVFKDLTEVFELLENSMT